MPGLVQCTVDLKRLKLRVGNFQEGPVRQVVATTSLTVYCSPGKAIRVLLIFINFVNLQMFRKLDAYEISRILQFFSIVSVGAR